MSEANSTETSVDYREIPGHEGFWAGSDGTIWTQWKREALRGQWGGTRLVRTDEKRRMNQRPNKRTGRLSVDIRQKAIGVPRLILLAFVGPCPDGMEACHDPNPDVSDNRLCNLRWDTPAANIADRDRHGRTARGIRHGVAKFTDDDVRYIRDQYDNHYTNQLFRQLAARFHADYTVVFRIAKRQAWKHVV